MILSLEGIIDFEIHDKGNSPENLLIQLRHLSNSHDKLQHYVIMSSYRMFQLNSFNTI